MNVEKEELNKLLESEENLTVREQNEFIWKDFINEEEDLTDEEKKAWEVRK